VGQDERIKMIYTQEIDGKMARSVRDGFTLIELIVVITIIAIITVVGGSQILGWIEKAKVSRAKTDLGNLHANILQYKAVVGKYPTRLQDLVKPADEKDRKKLPGGSLIDEVPVDPWNSPYQYKLTPGAAHPFDLYSWGENERGAPQAEWISVWDVK
jgi:general secretion pathway protein G